MEKTKVNRETLARHLVGKTKLPLKDARDVVDLVVQRIERALLGREIVELRGVGTIRWVTNTTTGGHVKDRVRLRPAMQFRGNGNGKR